MPQDTALTLYERNTEVLTMVATKEGTAGVAEDLTNAVVEVYFKPSADTTDTDAAVTQLVSPTDITIVDAPAGKYQFRLPTEVVSAPGDSYWRTDVLTDSGATRRTVMFGTVTVTNL